MQQAHVNLEDSTWAALQHIASLHGVEVSDLIRSAVEEKYLRTARARGSVPRVASTVA